MAERLWEVDLLLLAWSDIDRVLAGVSDEDAILQNAIHHNYHLGELATKHELLGHSPGTFPGSVLEARSRQL